MMKKSVFSVVVAPACLVAVVMGGAVGAGPALAARTAPQGGTPIAAAVTAATAPDAQTQELLENPGVAGVATDADGQTVVYEVAGQSPSLALPAQAKVEVLPEPLATDFDSRGSAGDAPTAVGTSPSAPISAVGGAGYLTTSDPEGKTHHGACSLGFIAQSPTGAPAAISAGHCAGNADYPYVSLSEPSSDPAGGGKGWQHLGNGGFGKFGFHQFGGPHDGPGATGALDSVDIAVIDVTGIGFSLVPGVTNWTTAASNNLAAGSVPITEVGPIQQGVPVTKSGRTTGSTTAEDTAYTTGWFKVSGHTIHGYGIKKLVGAGGDSGGAVYQGSRAIGVISGGSPSIQIVSDLVTSLPLTGGYKISFAQ